MEYKVKKSSKQQKELKQPKHSSIEKQKGDSTNKKRKYIDAKHFVPISSLFEKNPEIPSLTHSNATAKTKEIIFSKSALEDLSINNKLKSNLKDLFKFNSLTKIQMLSIPPLLNGKDVMIKSPTGSGKTMCYAIPIIEKLSCLDPPIHRSNGPYALILVPTRELAFQIFNVFQDLSKSSINIVPGILVGGEKCKAEKSRIRKGINILISTPGRLNYHLKETACLDLKNITWLVLDEVDRLLDMGFLASVSEVVKEVDKRTSNPRQSVILSATLTSDIEILSKLSMNNPITVDETMIDEADHKPVAKKLKIDQQFTLPESLDQSYVFVPAKLRLVSLFTFLASKSFVGKEKSKAIVFMPNKASVNLYKLIFTLVLKEKYNLSEKICQQVFQLQGDLNQHDRFETYKKFQQSSSGVMFCTDVAARGLDIKQVDWIIQYSCPQQIEDYCHKVGRTARIGSQGRSLLFLQPAEKDYIDVLASHSIVLTELTLDDLLSDSLKCYGNKKMKNEDKATEIQNFIEETLTIEKDYHQMAVTAYFAFIQSYSTYPSTMKEIFHPKKLHLGHVAKSFGLRDAPGKLKSGVPSSKQKTKEKNAKPKSKKFIIPADGIYSGPRPKSKAGKKKKGSKKKIRI